MSASRAAIYVGVGMLAALSAITVADRYFRSPREDDGAEKARRDREPSTEDVVRRTLPSVVRIEVLAADGSQRAGTGFVVDRRGVVATNKHVVVGAVRIEIVLPDKSKVSPAKLIGIEAAPDITLMTVPRLALPALVLRTDPPATVGEAVLAIGHPLGLQDTVTEGIVSGRRELPDGSVVIQTSAAISSGNSGGPLLDKRGRVIGVVTWKILSRGAESLGFAIGVDKIAELLEPGADAIAADAYYAKAGRPDLGRSVIGQVRTAVGGGSAAHVSGVWHVLGTGSTYVVLQDDSPGAASGQVLTLSRPLPSGALPPPSQRPQVVGVHLVEMHADGSGNWHGTGKSTWHCSCSTIERGSDGVYSKRDMDRECPFEWSLNLQAVGRDRLYGDGTIPNVPRKGDSGYDQACKTCLVRWAPTSGGVYWERIADAGDW